MIWRRVARIVTIIGCGQPDPLVDRGSIGLVSQDVFLFTGSIRDNILYGRTDASEEEMIQAAKDANIHDFISELQDGYDTWVGEKGIRLSGGQKQRISITRVFLKNPPILILDEATEGLAPLIRKEIWRGLGVLKSKGLAILIIDKNLDALFDLAEHHYVMEKGMIVWSGTTSELAGDNELKSRYLGV